MEGFIVLKSEVMLAPSRGEKAIGPDEILTNMLTVLNDFGIDNLTKLTNKIYDNGEISEEHRSVFIVSAKKNQIQMNANISMMCNITMLIIKILMNRDHRRINLKLRQEQCGFAHDTGKRNAIFRNRML